MAKALKVYRCSMSINGHYEEVMMATTKTKFKLVTGTPEGYFNEEPRPDRVAIALAQPETLLRWVPRTEKTFEVVPESEWHFRWRDHQDKQANSVTGPMFDTLVALRDGKTVPVPAKLVALGLVTLGGVHPSLTETGRRIATWCERPDTPVVVRGLLLEANGRQERHDTEQHRRHQEALRAANDAVAEVARRVFRQQATMDDLEQAVLALERLEADGPVATAVAVG